MNVIIRDLETGTPYRFIPIEDIFGSSGYAPLKVPLLKSDLKRLLRLQWAAERAGMGTPLIKTLRRVIKLVMVELERRGKL